MTPKEKAQELVGRHTSQEIRCISNEGGNLHTVFCFMAKRYAKVFATFIVDEILIEHVSLDFCLSEQDERIAYWKDVKEEIAKL
jgi:hypothetical protein